MLFNSRTVTRVTKEICWFYFYEQLPKGLFLKTKIVTTLSRNRVQSWLVVCWNSFSYKM